MSRYVFNRASTFDDAGFCLPFNGAQVYPDRESYRVMAAEYDYIPFYARAAVTDFDAAGLFKFINPSPPACLLESLSGDDNGRYSIIAFSSLREITAPLDHTRGIDPLREFFATTRVPQLDFPFFSGGLAGYWSYEEALLYQCLPVNKTGFAEQFFFMPGEILVFDRRLNMLMVIIWVKTGGVGEEDYDQACSRLDGRIRQAVNCQGRPGQRPTVFITGRLDQEFRVNIDRDDFCHLVREAQEHIKQGDIFQVVLSRRWSKKSPADPWEVYLNLRSINPSPYMFYLQLPDSVLMGASPEMQVKIEKNRIKSRPIAGTRKITGDALADARMARELLADEKELAEHLMLVDLSRNDIGRVSRSGTVEVDKFMVLEKYSHVMHIVSNVAGELKPEVDALEAFQACFPAGTLSGAPKRKAMEIINRLETDPRGPYGGATGYIDFNRQLDSCITIRSILYKNRTYYLQSGAGIVADSVPELEHEETLHKARVLMLAIKEAEKQNAFDDR